MALSNVNQLSEGAYFSLLYDMIKQRENPWLYAGTGYERIHNGGGDGNPTFGYGFNLNAFNASVVEEVILHAYNGALTAQQNNGLDLILDWKTGASVLVNGQYVTLTNANIINMADVSLNGAPGAFGTTSQRAAIQSLSLNDAQATRMLDVMIKGDLSLVHIEGPSGSWGYEDGLDYRLADEGSPAYSTERAALLSVYYNAPVLIGPGVQNAILNDERAQLWYEIRYNHNHTNHNGLQSRRAEEADLLGLVSQQAKNSTGSNIDEYAAALDTLYNGYDRLGRRILTRIEDRDGLDNFEDAIAPELQVLLDYFVLQPLGAANAPAIDYVQAAASHVGVQIDAGSFEAAGVTNGKLAVDTVNLILGGGGDDVITGGGAADYLYGGAGNDTIYGDGGGTSISDAGHDLIDGGDGNDSLIGGYGDEFITGGKGNDVIEAGHGNDVIDGGTGADTIRGGDGNDFVNGGTSSDEIFGDTGDDTIEGGGAADTLYGDAGKDQLFGGFGADLLQGGTNNDTLVGDGGADSLFGEGGQDFALGGTGDDLLEGGDGNDTLDGENRHDQLYGQGGNDNLFGGAGIDLLVGGSGNDSVDGGGGNDDILGGPGADTLFGGAANDIVVGGDDDDELDGGNGLDTIYGGAGDDQLVGGAGEDSLIGNDGDDILFGSNRTDTLIGGAGADTLTGGNHDDVFVFSVGDGVDTFTDFWGDFGNGDVIDLVGMASEGIISFADILDVTSDDGLGNAVIDFGGGDAIILSGVTTASLHEDDFIFG